MKNLYVLTGASRGLGLAIAQQLLRPENQLLCLSRHTNAALETEASAAGCALEQWSADLGDCAPVAARLARYLAAQPSAQHSSATLINNAGMIPPLLPLAQSEPQNIATALRVGLEAPMQLCAAFLGATAHWNQPRKVLNISSGLGRRAMASSAAYCAAKAGMDHFSRCVALEEAAKPNGATICSLAPGVVDTDMQTQLRSADPQAFADQARFAALHTQGQLSSPQDTARRLLNWLQRADFGAQVVADVRD